jgi:hypothetical protein
VPGQGQQPDLFYLLMEASSQERVPLAVKDTACRQLLLVLAPLGKAAVKRCLEPILLLLTDCVARERLDAGARATAYAAGDAVAQIRRLVSPAIFSGRMTPAQAAVLARSDAVPRL